LSGATWNDVAGRIRPAGLVFDTCGLYVGRPSWSRCYSTHTHGVDPLLRVCEPVKAAGSPCMVSSWHTLHHGVQHQFRWLIGRGCELRSPGQIQSIPSAATPSLGLIRANCKGWNPLKKKCFYPSSSFLCLFVWRWTDCVACLWFNDTVQFTFQRGTLITLFCVCMCICGGRFNYLKDVVCCIYTVLSYVIILTSIFNFLTRHCCDALPRGRCHVETLVNY